MTRFLSLKVARSLLLASFLGLVSTGVQSQNLVPNPGFEVFTSCPGGYNAGYDPLLATPWFVPNLGSSDYFNACSGGVVGVPENAFGTLPAHTGFGYGGGLDYYAGIADYREYLHVRLTSPLEVGKSYVAAITRTPSGSHLILSTIQVQSTSLKSYPIPGPGVPRFGFPCTQDENIRFSFYRVSGELIKTEERMFAQGDHALRVKREDLMAAQGMAIGRLENSGLHEL